MFYISLIQNLGAYKQQYRSIQLCTFLEKSLISGITLLQYVGHSVSNQPM